MSPQDKQMIEIPINTQENIHFKSCYDIIITHGFCTITDKLKQLQLDGRACCIVTDSNVAKFYLSVVEEELRKSFHKVYSFVFTCGEDSKTLQTVNDLYKYLVDVQFDRNDILIALGGGVTGDLTGFCAATYMRGIRFIQIPTTLLAMVDASIGGKTGVDLEQYKNMVGAFHMPMLVYINIECLNTLDKRQMSSGMAEIIKAAVIQSKTFYEWIVLHQRDILSMQSAVLIKMIQQACLIKKSIIESDPYEKGLRMLLNYGHTIGHAIEKEHEFRLLHGECVALGMLAAMQIDVIRGSITNEEYKCFLKLLRAFSLPTFCQIDLQQLTEDMKHDKKANGAFISFILLTKLGEGRIDPSVSRQEIMTAVENSIAKV